MAKMTEGLSIVSLGLPRNDAIGKNYCGRTSLRTINVGAILLLTLFFGRSNENVGTMAFSSSTTFFRRAPIEDSSRSYGPRLVQSFVTRLRVSTEQTTEQTTEQGTTEDLASLRGEDGIYNIENKDQHK